MRFNSGFVPSTQWALIVESDVCNLGVLSEIVEDLGFVVEWAETTREALDVLNKRTAPPSFVIAANAMPLTSALDLLTVMNFELHLSRIPVIVITEGAPPRTHTPATYWIRQPYTRRDLVEAITAISANANAV